MRSMIYGTLLSVATLPAIVCEAQLAQQSFSIPNFDESAPPCKFSIPANVYACEPLACQVKAPEKSSLGKVQVNFTCVPIGAITFERPPSDAKLYGVRSRNARGEIMFTDENKYESKDPMRNMMFCLRGAENVLCGDAKTLRLKDGNRNDATPAIKAFIREISLEKPFVPN